eukprot:m.31858 g.31858  ORF g.31858 m.31858 type:complete len:100 (-) comp6982_c0_seq1:36-335(-)
MRDSVSGGRGEDACCERGERTRSRTQAQLGQTFPQVERTSHPRDYGVSCAKFELKFAWRGAGGDCGASDGTGWQSDNSDSPEIFFFRPNDSRPHNVVLE